MTSGKSSIGRLLAKEMDIPFIDLDDFIENELQKSITDIFLEKGEIKFRKIENEMLSKVLDENDSVILATGGGTPCYGGNMKTILENSDYSIYLQLSIASLVERIEKEKEQRPLVRDIAYEDLPEFVGKHLFERRQYYAQANHILDCENKAMVELAEEIKELLL